MVSKLIISTQRLDAFNFWLLSNAFLCVTLGIYDWCKKYLHLKEGIWKIYLTTFPLAKYCVTK